MPDRLASFVTSIKTTEESSWSKYRDVNFRMAYIYFPDVMNDYTVGSSSSGINFRCYQSLLSTIIALSIIVHLFIYKINY